MDLAERMPEMLAMGMQNSWLFSLCEMFSSDHYRTDGL